MGKTKIKEYTKQVTDLAKILKVLGNPARMGIIEFLAKSPSCICNDIVDEFPLAQPTISGHLSELKKVGLIQGSNKGKNIYYCINKEKWSDVKKLGDEIFSSASTYDKCC